MVCAILKFATAPLNNKIFLCFRIFDRSGLNFKGIELKISQIVRLAEGYNLCKFEINSLQIEVGTSFFVWQKFFNTC